jgi:hypothetical protein
MLLTKIFGAFSDAPACKNRSSAVCQRAHAENDLNRVDQRSESCRPQTSKCVDHRSTGGNSVPAGVACVKSGKGRVAPVYSREISKISQRNSRIRVGSVSDRFHFRNVGVCTLTVYTQQCTDTLYTHFGFACLNKKNRRFF